MSAALRPGACNDCGAPLADAAEIGAHAEEKHPGMGRYRFWDGKVEEITYTKATIEAMIADLQKAAAKLGIKLQVAP